MKEIILEHFTRYPLMQPADAVKLLYQSEFGGGHMIADPDALLQRLIDEYTRVTHDFTLPLTEAIGGGMLRVNLHAVDPGKTPLSGIQDAFVRSAAAKKGSYEDFTRKIDLLISMASHGDISVRFDDLLAYLDGYLRIPGCPAVSHSEVYKKAYDPAYRIVCADIWDQIISL